ncbi:hypothetical protein GCM10012287_28670 [Streptomyces daqingensis]|uniref:Transposase n=1 Tax=Streptomyces daqingensis TaxID=1472640 RepID=A0ABQ2MH51_9ACTN|nr:hypothetical protein [Streptomyces daqingensis]GGO49998.1 hypothetical protein GCM10012287_28670 [Streptomyces daqingensis]
MISFITDTQMTDRSVVASCLLDSRLNGIGVSRVVPSSGVRQTKGSAAAAQAVAYVRMFAAPDAGIRNEEPKHNPTWAFRGLEPWRDPA